MNLQLWATQSLLAIALTIGMKFSLNQKLGLGFVTVAVLAAIVGGVGLFGLRKSSATLQEVRAQVADSGAFLVEATDTARSAQVRFKIQVQEWKNILLRGTDLKAFEKY